MKVCFFLQRRFAYIGHALACRLKETEPSMQFCGVVQTRPSLRYLQSQTDLTYTSLLLEGDFLHKIKEEKIDPKYLTVLEKEYGLPTLWPYLYVDRIVMNGQLKREYPYNHPTLSHNDMLRLVQITARKLTAFLDR